MTKGSCVENHRNLRSGEDIRPCERGCLSGDCNERDDGQQGSESGKCFVGPV